jgi:hypothetical protein
MWPRIALSFMAQISLVCIDCWVSFGGWDDRFGPINTAPDQPGLGITGRFDTGLFHVRSIATDILINRICGAAIGKSLGAPAITAGWASQHKGRVLDAAKITTVLH